MKGIIPWRSRGEVDRFRGEVDRMFDAFFSRGFFGRSGPGEEWMPALDVAETEK